ncbi:hypothetical protein SAMN04487870_0999 [Pseudoalteromonas sp. DSM 26666]|uniref:hypothetical protein n=2 Tax=Pseudoalteromonas TaxID=53246 RepID=UPI000519F4F7|nr:MULTISPECIES: hypothetical protein [unclassified Pseudoalteromonas]KGJ96600.1 hypothetical protein ND6B_3794 [Pseudoalteromonas sp. ND6B]SFT59854.1 hypothetical protein SAMN04487870_0999 [Pseudoalteromonas sp. DSM 26666]
MSTNLTVKQRNALQRVRNEPALKPWLFKKVDDLVWFDAFLESGYLDPECNPAPVTKSDGTIHIPSWPITEYLVSSSLKLREENDVEMARKYLSLLKEVTQYAVANERSNYRTWWQFSKILRNIPLEVINLDDIGCVSDWLNDKFDRYLVNKEISEWMLELIDINTEQSVSFGIFLLDKLFAIHSVEGRYADNKHEAVLGFDDYQAGKFIEENAAALGEKLGLVAVNLCEQKLKEVLDINRNDKWSNVWRNAIPEHKQSSRHNDADDIVLKLFRDALLGYVKEDSDNNANEKLTELINSDYQTIKRVAIYVASVYFEKLEQQVITLVIQPNHFNDKYRHELWHFIHKNFSSLRAEQQKSVIAAIESLNVTDEETGVLLDKPTAYKQSNWFAAIKDENEVTQAKYQACVDITGAEPDHPDFSCYMSGGVAVDVSPLSVSELAVMLEDIDSLIHFLNEYKEVGHFNEPGIEGLVNTFEELVLLDSCEILNNLDSFIDLKPHYLDKIFSAYSKLWTDKAQRPWNELWPKIINFATKLFNEASFWNSVDNTDSGPFIGDKHWVISSYCRLVESGCEKDEHAFSLELTHDVKNTLELILNKASGEDFNDDSDAVSMAINSPRGRCLEAYFKLALYQCRNVEKDSEEHIRIWAGYQPTFDNELSKPHTAGEYEFITILLMYVRNFLYLSKDWTVQNIEQMFGETNSLQWRCAIQAYSYVGWLIPEIHAHFKEKQYYPALLDDESFSDTVKGRYIEYACIEYLQKRDQLDDESLLRLLLGRQKESELSKVVWFLWSIRDQNIEKTKELVFALWPDLVELINQQNFDKKPLASKLALWVEYIDELTVDTKAWLMAVAPYVNDDHNGMSFMKEMARLSEGYATDVADIWIETLSKPFYMYDLDPLETIFKNIISLGQVGQVISKKIADIYIKNNDEPVVAMYQRITK